MILYREENARARMYVCVCIILYDVKLSCLASILAQERAFYLPKLTWNYTTFRQRVYVSIVVDTLQNANKFNIDLFDKVGNVA